jgi:hypothetical protein
MIMLTCALLVPKENRGIVASQFGTSVKHLMTDFETPAQCRKQCSQIWANLQDALEEAGKPNNSGSTSALRDSSNVMNQTTSSNLAGLLGLKGNTTPAVSKPTNNQPIETYSFAVKGLVDDQARAEVEAALVKVVGVISFSINLSDRKVVVRARTGASLITSAIRSTGFTQVILLTDNKENEPDYLPESKYCASV